MPSVLLAALATSASAPVVPPKDAKKVSVLKKPSPQNPSKAPGGPPHYSSTLPATFSFPPALPPKDRRSLSVSETGSVKLKKSRSKAAATVRPVSSYSTLFQAALSASASVPVVPPIPPSTTSNSTRSRSVLKKSTSKNSLSSVLTHFIGTARPRCVVCKVYCASEEYSDIACSLICLEKFCLDGPTDRRMCNVCLRRPKEQGEQHCGRTCADMAESTCLLCRFRPKNGKHNLCSLTCKRIAMKLAPLILEVPKGHVIYSMVQRRFKNAWKGNSTIPTIRRVFKIIENEDFQRPYERYRERIGPEECYRYHGTSRQCQLGVSTKTLCASSSCAICNILKCSFRVDVAKTSGAFGMGIYTSSASSKAYDFCHQDGALLLNKVVLGRVKQVHKWGEVTRCPRGYDSVVFEHMNGSRNETIVYSDDAIRPVFLIIFQ